MWSLGVDYGTRSWKMALLEDGAVRDLASLSSMDQAVAYVTAHWTARPGLPMVLPSGFGVPLTRLAAAGPRELFAMSLRKGDPAGDGLGLFLRRLQQAGVDGYCPPSVKLLPSVPLWRTLDKVDMGTSDKMCAAAYLVALRHEREGVPLDAITFLCLEVGYAFKCWMVVQGGRIVDGIGGTRGSMGPRARGAIDGELAYLHGFARKEDIYSGGWAALSAQEGEEMAALAFWEGLTLERLALTAYHGATEILVCGRRRAQVVARWSGLPGLTVSAPHEDTQGYEAALGAALLANGLAGGRWSWLSDHLGLREARGHPLDRIAWGNVPRPDAGP